MFEISCTADGMYITLKANNGKYVSAKVIGDVKADSSRSDEAEQWEVQCLNSPGALYNNSTPC